jgi:DNA-directed RNA polymerase specialized sigma subunit
MPYHYLAKLSEGQVKQIWRLYWEDHWTQNELAKRFKVSQPTISNIVHKEFYRAITKPFKVPKNWKGRTCSSKPTGKAA